MNEQLIITFSTPKLGLEFKEEDYDKTKPVYELWLNYFTCTELDVELYYELV